LGELYLGGLTYQIKLQAEHGSLEKEYDVPRQRIPIHPDVSFSQGKTVTVTPQFPRWDSETYMVGMSRFINQAVPMIRG
jgi:hypothetical protein